MHNIGLKKYNYLVQIDTLTGERVGPRKLNNPTDVDYIEPVWDGFDCPIPPPTTTTTTTTSTTTTTTSTTTTTTTTVRELVLIENTFKCHNNTSSLVDFKLFSSLPQEDLLSSLSIEPSGLGETMYSRDSLTSAELSVDIISPTLYPQLYIAIKIAGSVVKEESVVDFQEYNFSFGYLISEPIEVFISLTPFDERIHSDEYNELYT